MSQGQKRPQNSSDCSICNLVVKNFRGRTLGPPPPCRCHIATLGSRYRPRNIYLLPHIQGGRSTTLCLFLFGTSEYNTTSYISNIEHNNITHWQGRAFQCHITGFCGNRTVLKMYTSLDWHTRGPILAAAHCFYRISIEWLWYCESVTCHFHRAIHVIPVILM